MPTMVPVATFGLEVRPGETVAPALAAMGPLFDFRITMAAIDPSATVKAETGTIPRATLKLVRTRLDENEFDLDELDEMYADNSEDDDTDEDDDGEDDDDDDEMVNGGPSDPARIRRLAKKAAQQYSDSDEDISGTNGIKSAKARGKMPATGGIEDEGDVDEFVICTLDTEKTYQQPLDMTINLNDKRTYFKATGSHVIYLTGNYVDFDVDDEDESEGDVDDEFEDEFDTNLDEYGFEIDSENDELDDLVDPRITEIDENVSDDEAPALVAASAKKVAKKADKKGSNKRQADEDVSMGLDDSITLDKAPETNGEQKLSKKQLKKLKKNDGTAASAAAAPATAGAVNPASTATASDAPSSAKSDKKVSFAKNLEQGPTPTKDPKTNEKAKGPLGVKIVQGVTIDDRVLGKGAAAKAGERVSMRYIGKLQKDSSVFDKNIKGKPFSFKLGAGEVIRGWDIGIAGMSPGGERRITIPAHLAYGSKSLPGIPANSTLMFDVKCLDVKKK